MEDLRILFRPLHCTMTAYLHGGWLKPAVRDAAMNSQAEPVPRSVILALETPIALTVDRNLNDYARSSRILQYDKRDRPGMLSRRTRVD